MQYLFLDNSSCISPQNFNSMIVKMRSIPYSPHYGENLLNLLVIFQENSIHKSIIKANDEMS